MGVGDHIRTSLAGKEFPGVLGAGWIEVFMRVTDGDRERAGGEAFVGKANLGLRGAIPLGLWGGASGVWGYAAFFQNFGVGCGEPRALLWAGMRCPVGAPVGGEGRLGEWGGVGGGRPMCWAR